MVSAAASSRVRIAAVFVHLAPAVVSVAVRAHAAGLVCGCCQLRIELEGRAGKLLTRRVVCSDNDHGQRRDLWPRRCRLDSKARRDHAAQVARRAGRSVVDNCAEVKIFLQCRLNSRCKVMAGEG